MGDPSGRPLSVPQPDPFLGTLKRPLHSASALLSPGLCRSESGRQEPFVGALWWDAPCPAHRCASCLSLRCCRKRIKAGLFLSVWLLVSMERELLAPPGGRGTPAAQPAGQLCPSALTRAPLLAQWVRRLQAPAGVGPQGVSSGSGGWVPPWLCVPSTSCPGLILGGAGSFSQGRRPPHTGPRGPGGWSSPSQPGALSPWPRGLPTAHPRLALRLSPASGTTGDPTGSGGSAPHCLAGLTRDEQPARRDQKGFGLTFPLGSASHSAEGPGASRESSGG